MLGDSSTDAEAARSAGIPFYLVESQKSSSLPDSFHRYESLLEVTKELLGNTEP